MTPNSKLIAFMVTLACVFNAAIIFDVLANGNVALYDEGGFVEDISFFGFLSAAVALFGSAFYRARFDRYLTLFFATTCLMFFLREVDVGEMNIPFPIKQITSEDTKDGLFVVVFVALIIGFLRCYRGEIRSACKLLKSHVARCVLIGCAFFLVAAVFEQFEAIFAEELLETNAAFFILLAGLLHVLDPKNLTAGLD